MKPGVMTKKGTILVVDDNKTILQTLRLLLNGYFERVLTIASPNRIDTVLREEAVDIVLLDMNFSAGINSGNEGIYWLTRIKKINANIPVVVFTAYADIDLAVRAIKEGAADFVAKPWDNKKLIATLLAAYNLHRSKQEVKYLKEMKHELSTETPMFWGTSRAMQQVRAMVDKVADYGGQYIDHRRERDGQGGTCRGDSPAVVTGRRADGLSRYGRTDRDTVRERVVRSRQGSLHRCPFRPDR